jgi:hypothetical protein
MLFYVIGNPCKRHENWKENNYKNIGTGFEPVRYLFTTNLAPCKTKALKKKEPFNIEQK